MSDYKFDLMLKTSVGNEIGIDTAAGYGYFTKRDGSEGGGLWFERVDVIGKTGIAGCLELVDYDGVIALPMHVYLKLLDQPNLIIDEAFDPNYEV